ncbi:glycolipid transfer protein [Kluyveromyces marxianus]|uniref:Glycolipid transfer protein n=2 Tax=Kluyveromyces marxianus TaxID=4911 RepID=W0T9Z9_KLUMD|nr:glycolipid transfer protein [Kluyveromyces marxianus DMKU3-1042]QGN15563.1 glycolipid transfer protein [Kluyveromyces marxianus]BAO39848.1 glycolipid transfer protein [Kluyveromyces marxianus DMKU3-1042]BAP71332.1 glycolipid transfer protein [Kluyveromyces marxianus]
MSTFFDDMKRSFEAVPLDSDKKISTPEFLEASESLVKLFDVIGNPAFGMVQNDLTGNIEKVRKRYLAKPDESAKLQDLVTNERAEGQKTASEGLLWLNRGLQFTAQAMTETIENPSMELPESFTNAYKKTLSKHHNMLLKPVFKFAMKACPYRKDFFEKLGADQDKVNKQLEAWVAALSNIVAILLEFLATTCKDL